MNEVILIEMSDRERESEIERGREREKERRIDIERGRERDKMRKGER